MQKIKIRESHEEFNVRDLVHPFLENGILYLRMITVDDNDKPTHFLSLMPMDILYRLSDYDEKIMAEINEASDQARADQNERIAAMEENIDDTVVDEFNSMYHG